MNLKSYTRGIGAGLIVSALVLGIGGSRPEKLTDIEIKARASELGMIEAQTLTQITEKTDESVMPSKDEKEELLAEDISVNEKTDISENNELNESEEIEPVPEFKEPDEVTVEPIVEETAEPEIAPINPMPEDETGFVSNEEGVEIQIVRGDSSVTVARRMYEAGLIESAYEFDKFLCANGYDKVICVGNYSISYGLSFDEMAKIITRR